MMTGNDNKDIEKIKNNMREFCDHWFVPGEDSPAEKNDTMERTGEIQDQPLHNLVDGKNKSDNGEKKIDETAKNEQLPEDRKNLIAKKVSKIAMYKKVFLNEEVPFRESILGSWFREGNIGFVFGRRGVGKTWFAWDMAINISNGMYYGPWKCESPWKTLYIDGEMSLGAMQERLKLLDQGQEDNLIILSWERMMDKERELLNLCDPCYQEVILDYCMKEKVKVVFLDNLSSLFRGMKENEADSWEQVLDWLLTLRQSGIAVVIVHHANRDGNDMRGTSRREDAADWVIKVSPNFKFAKINEGTAFTTTFTKNREDNGKHEESMDWTFITEDGKTNVSCHPTDLETLVYDLIKNDGMEYCSDIAESLNRSKMEVSRCAKRLMDKGFIKKEGHRYVLSYDSVDDSETTLEKD
jgi:hypothetical protein